MSAADEQDDFKPEIYVALCGAAGTDLNSVCKIIAREFSTFGYSAKVIGLSSLFSKLAAFSGISKSKHEDDRIEAAMDAGNKIRDKIDDGDAAARLAIAAIREFRTAGSGSPNGPRQGTVYIIKSIKNKAEYDTLSRIYKDAFFMLSVYEPRAERVKNLKRLISKTRKCKLEDSHNRAVELIDRDDNELGNDLGQGVRDAFQLGDVFVEAGNNANSQIHRAVGLVFGAPFVTPTRNEFAMFHAYAASLRAADLSRQVGAVIINDDGDVVSEGCNEVPKVGGGVIWEEEVDDPASERRDFGLGYDSTAVMKRQILEEVVGTIKDIWLKDELAAKPVSSLVDELLSKDSVVSLREARISNIIEFGRIVHAEMGSLMDAARRGVPVRGKTLFCTTFPCHMCARHIISAGIKQVFFIEPYPKSLAKDLYESEILVDAEVSSGRPGVQFRPFVGVAPKRLPDWFKMGPRKNSDGWALPKLGSNSSRKIARTVWLPPDEEAVYEESLEALEEFDVPIEN